MQPPDPRAIADAYVTSIPVLTVIIAGIVTILGALAQLIVSVITAIKVGKIEAHTNSQKTADQGAIALRDTKIDMLERQLRAQATTAALLAQAATTPSERGVRRTDTHEPMPVEIVTSAGPVPVAIVPADDK